MDDTGTGRNDAESLESLLAPLEEFVAFTIAVELDLEVFLKGVGGAIAVDLNGVVDHEIDGDERFDERGVLPEVGNGLPHGGEVDKQGNAGKVLKDDTGHNEGDFTLVRILRVPFTEGGDVVRLDALAIAVTEERFENYTNTGGQS